MNRFKLFFVLRSGIILIFLASLTVSPATEALAAPIESKSSISCLPGMSCFFGVSCGEGEGDDAVGVQSSSGAVPCSHRSNKNVQASSSAHSAGASAQETGSSLPSAGGSHAVPSLPTAGNIESDSKQNSGLTLEDSMSWLENEAHSFKTAFSEVPGFWNPPLEFSAQSSGFSAATSFEYNHVLSVIFDSYSNDTLHNYCPAIGSSENITRTWIETYVKPIADRLNAAAPGANLKSRFGQGLGGPLYFPSFLLDGTDY
ncbi:hypothetical protein EV360DRAFT_86240 [Lentinula raphanica]|nr:hypothetical protein EV360DRAFT_86240 [Lentinula raphanica]